MLANPDSKIIRAYGVLNPEAFGMQGGMARPGYFFVDPNGIIREKFFDPRYRDRLTGNSLVARLFPELGQAVTENVDAPHLQLTLQQSDPEGISGTTITVVAEISLPEDMHVYAPGAHSYKPTRLVMDPIPDVVFGEAVYPSSKTLFLPAIKETVPVYEGTFRIVQPVQVSTRSDAGGVGRDGKLVTLTGKLEYQACDKTICFLPTSVPVKWQLRVFPLDRIRAPMDIRHK